ncbi:hypothetical protein RMCBS344292_03559 [Rhizopus microsporus]|nr:hypothetical protein RMCBS344292_03559 [Rhizopus microsporus]
MQKVDILDSFDGRLLQLEASILPIHKSTQNLTKLANSNIHISDSSDIHRYGFEINRTYYRMPEYAQQGRSLYPKGS